MCMFWLFEVSPIDGIKVGFPKILPISRNSEHSAKHILFHQYESHQLFPYSSRRLSYQVFI